MVLNCGALELRALSGSVSTNAAALPSSRTWWSRCPCSGQREQQQGNRLEQRMLCSFVRRYPKVQVWWFRAHELLTSGHRQRVAWGAAWREWMALAGPQAAVKRRVAVAIRSVAARWDAMGAGPELKAAGLPEASLALAG